MNDWFPLCLPTAVVELQTTGSVQHIVNLLFIDYTQYTENDSKTQVNEQRFLRAGLEGVAGRQLDHNPDTVINKKIYVTSQSFLGWFIE